MTNFVIDSVEKPGNYWENGGLQGFHVIWQQSDVTLEESHLSPSTIHHCLQETPKQSHHHHINFRFSCLCKYMDCNNQFNFTVPAQLFQTCVLKAGMKCWRLLALESLLTTRWECKKKKKKKDLGEKKSHITGNLCLYRPQSFWLHQLHQRPHSHGLTSLLLGFLKTFTTLRNMPHPRKFHSGWEIRNSNQSHHTPGVT